MNCMQLKLELELLVYFFDRFGLIKFNCLRFVLTMLITPPLCLTLSRYALCGCVPPMLDCAWQHTACSFAMCIWSSTQFDKPTKLSALLSKHEHIRTTTHTHTATERHTSASPYSRAQPSIYTHNRRHKYMHKHIAAHTYMDISTQLYILQLIDEWCVLYTKRETRKRKKKRTQNNTE